MNNLQKNNGFNTAVDQNNLTQSLLTFAQTAGVIDETEADRIRLSLLELLSIRIWQYTGKKSYSVRQETAEELLQSLLYTLDTRLTLCPPEEALELLQTRSTERLFEEGLELVKAQVEKAKALLPRFTASRQTGILALENTLDRAIPAFFEGYDPEFFAHQIPAMIDYPLLKPVLWEKGIAFIHEYLGHLLMEEQLLTCWPPIIVRQTLARYGIANEDDYRQMLVNASETLLYGAAAAMLAGRVPDSPFLSAEECVALQQTLLQQDIAVVAGNAFSELLGRLHLTDPARSYLLSSRHEFACRLSVAIKHNALHRLLPCAVLPPGAALQFQDNPPMPDPQFNWVVNRLTGCGNPEEKAAFIRRHVKSLADLADLFEADCLFEGEYDAVFSLLVTIELAVLFSRRIELPSDKMKALSPDCWRYDRDTQWLPPFVRFLASLPPDRLQSVLDTAGQLALHS